MKGKEFGNIIDYTIKHMPEDLKGDSVGTVKEIFRNCGVEFYKGSLNEVKEVLETNDYMSWETCEAEDVRDLADNGVAVVGIKDDEIFIVVPETHLEPEEGHENIRKMSELNEDTIDGIVFFATTNTVTATPKIPKRIAQNGPPPLSPKKDPQWDETLWKYNGKDYTGSASVACSVACVSMALSCIGINKTPGAIIYAQGGSVEMQWTKFGSISDETSASAVQAAVNRYKANPAKYAPPIVQVRENPSPSNSHFVVVCGYNSDKTKFMAVDPGPNGYDNQNGTIRYYYWAPLSSQRAIQYYK